MKSTSLWMVFFLSLFFNIQAKACGNKYGSLDSLQYFAKKNFYLVGYSIKGDTLQLISSSPFVARPFGQIYKLDNLGRHFSKHLELFHPLNDTAFKADTFQVLTKNKSFVKFRKDITNYNILEIVSGEIMDKGLKLCNAIEIGTSFDCVLKKFFTRLITPTANGPIRVIELVSGITDCRQYYLFKENKLAKISFRLFMPGYN